MYMYEYKSYKSKVLEVGCIYICMQDDQNRQKISMRKIGKMTNWVKTVLISFFLSKIFWKLHITSAPAFSYRSAVMRAEWLIDFCEGSGLPDGIFFLTKTTTLGKFLERLAVKDSGKFYCHLVSFTAISFILWPLGIFVVILVYFYSFGMLRQKNLATLVRLE
jgi:hypothetical protein